MGLCSHTIYTTRTRKKTMMTQVTSDIVVFCRDVSAFITVFDDNYLLVMLYCSNVQSHLFKYCKNKFLPFYHLVYLLSLGVVSLIFALTDTFTVLHSWYLLHFCLLLASVNSLLSKPLFQINNFDSPVSELHRSAKQSATCPPPLGVPRTRITPGWWFIFIVFALLKLSFVDKDKLSDVACCIRYRLQ